MRTFISVELPDEVREKISGAVEALKKVNAAVKWVEPKNLHITLKFLGEVPEGEIDNLKDRVAEAVKGKKSFPAEFSGVGTFPEGRKPRVIWAGTAKGGKEQEEIAASLEKALSKAGFREEERGFKPHITIGRVKEGKNLDALLGEIEKMKGKPFGGMMVEDINLMKSRLSPKGPIYEEVKSIRLG